MKPTIMSAEDVRALLDGRKTMARVPIKPQPYYFYNSLYEEQKPLKGDRLGAVMPDNTDSWIKSPYRPGDVLWVRETWARLSEKEYLYQADDTDVNVWKIRQKNGISTESDRWMSPVTMPREAARLFLRVKDVRVEKNQESGAWEWLIEFDRIEKGEES